MRNFIHTFFSSFKVGFKLGIRLIFAEKNLAPFQRNILFLTMKKHYDEIEWFVMGDDFIIGLTSKCSDKALNLVLKRGNKLMVMTKGLWYIDI